MPTIANDDEIDDLDRRSHLRAKFRPQAPVHGFGDTQAARDGEKDRRRADLLDGRCEIPHQVVIEFGHGALDAAR